MFPGVALAPLELCRTECDGLLFFISPWEAMHKRRKPNVDFTL